MGIEILIPALFALKAAAITAFAVHQIMSTQEGQEKR